MSLVLKLLTIWAEQKRLETDLSHCSRHRNKNNTCSKCLDICPSPHAIQLESIPKWNADHCLECMHCTVVCPTQVFQDKRYKEILNSIINREVVRFSCEKRGSKVHDVRLPCLFQLELLHLLLAGEVTNHIHVCLDRDTCKDCPLYRDGLEGDVHAVVNTAREIFMITGSNQNLHVVDGLDDGTVGEQTISRRDFFRKVISKASSEMLSQQLMDCLDCGLCKEVCEEQALTYEEDVLLQEFCCSDPIPINKRMLNRCEPSKEEIDSYFL